MTPVLVEEGIVKKMHIVLGVIVVAAAAAAAIQYQFLPSRFTMEALKEATEVQAKLDEERAPEPDPAPAEPVAAAVEPAPAAPAAPAAQQKGDVVKVKFETTQGDFVVEVHRDWAPNGAGRFLELVNMKFFDGNRFFRVVTEPKPFVVQWGIPGEPALAKQWWNKNIPDDPVKESNTKGTMTFAAGRAPNSRSTQVFINLNDQNTFLDKMGFAPFGRIVEGMEVVTRLNNQYQEQPTQMQMQIRDNGNAWLDQRFPGLDYVKAAAVTE